MTRPRTFRNVFRVLFSKTLDTPFPSYFHSALYFSIREIKRQCTLMMLDDNKCGSQSKQATSEKKLKKKNEKRNVKRILNTTSLNAYFLYITERDLNQTPDT